jgi:methionyl-tRNA formyltransferase
MGDSRIVPASFLQKNIVIGNHGAVLPRVQGAASLTWGRMLNTGHWGVSLMRLNAQIDAGEILATKEITYNTDNTSMQEFVEMCDNATVDLVENHFEGNYKKIKNKKWDIKVAKGVDSEKVIGILRTCLQAGLNIYLPPRNPYDAKINLLWKTSFIEGFKKANNLPYPKYYIEK